MSDERNWYTIGHSEEQVEGRLMDRSRYFWEDPLLMFGRINPKISSEHRYYRVSLTVQEVYAPKYPAIDTRIEAVAKAMYKLTPLAIIGGNADWDELPDAHKSEHRLKAEAAIAEHSAYLWSQVDSYDFFEALEEWVNDNDNHEPEMIAQFAVESLIGPRPNEEQETPNG